MTPERKQLASLPRSGPSNGTRRGLTPRIEDWPRHQPRGAYAPANRLMSDHGGGSLRAIRHTEGGGLEENRIANEPLAIP